MASGIGSIVVKSYTLVYKMDAQKRYSEWFTISHSASVWKRRCRRANGAIGTPSKSQVLAIASINRWILTENKPLVYKASNILSDKNKPMHSLSLIHISEPTRLGMISY